MKKQIRILKYLVFFCIISFLISSLRATEWTERNTDRIAFPIGGIGSGMFCVERTGTISHLSPEHGMNFFHEPTTFAAIHVKETKNGTEKSVGKVEKEIENLNLLSPARVLEGPVPEWKFFGIPGSGTGSTGRTYRLPRFRECKFTSRFPFCEIALRDDTFPVETQITGFSPFIPSDGDASSFPTGTLDYTLKNTGSEPLEVVFLFHSRYFMGGDKISAFPAGFRLVGPRECAVSVMNQENVAVDHCWFRGGWWDAFTMTWNNIVSRAVISNPPDDGKAPGDGKFTFPAFVVSSVDRKLKT
ncbi:MAG: GH116 family glycosyl-hydrolase [Planctomycetia bacterium]|nr:GH116 family glycosyl-hydrolase [Planctomycetia bacterium]